MTDGDALLAAICAHPYDDTPRLAYADWLDEQGGKASRDRAEFIRLQIELHGKDDNPANTDKQIRVNALQSRYYKKWSAPLIGRGGPLFGKHTFTNHSRGFIHRAGGTAKKWVANGDAVMRLAPITNASVDDLTDEYLKQLVASEWAKRLDTMELTSPFDTNEYEYSDEPNAEWPDFARFAAGQFPNLKYLWFSAGALDERGAAKVALANPMPNLETLQFCETQLTAGTLGKLFGGKAFKSVRELYFSDCGLMTEELEVLARCKALKGVKELDMPSLALDDAGLTALTSATFWPTLRRLDISDGNLGPAGMRALGRTPSTLEELELTTCRITAAGMTEFTSGGGVRGLKELTLRHNPIGAGGFISLTRWPYFGKLEHLDVSNCGIGPTGVKALAACPAAVGLKSLSLYGNLLTETGCTALAYLGGIEWIQLGGGVPRTARKLLEKRFGDRVSM
jgi:uncharacterized protein (TIGR02996 family)